MLRRQYGELPDPERGLADHNPPISPRSLDDGDEWGSPRLSYLVRVISRPPPAASVASRIRLAHATLRAAASVAFYSLPSGQRTSVPYLSFQQQLTASTLAEGKRFVAWAFGSGWRTWRRTRRLS